MLNFNRLACSYRRGSGAGLFSPCRPAARPAPHLTHRPRPESRPAPRRYRRVTLAWAVLACVLALAALATPALAQTVVPADWSLKPTGLAAGGKFRLLFLSSTKRNAIATGIATYNTFVQARAAAGHADIQGYSAGFRAVGCTPAVDARNNTATTYAHTGLRPGTTRHYRVSAINSIGTSTTPSNVDSATTGTTDDCAGGTTRTCSVSPAEAQGSVRDRHL